MTGIRSRDEAATVVHLFGRKEESKELQPAAQEKHWPIIHPNARWSDTVKDWEKWLGRELCEEDIDVLRELVAKVSEAPRICDLPMSLKHAFERADIRGRKASTRSENARREERQRKAAARAAMKAGLDKAKAIVDGDDDPAVLVEDVPDELLFHTTMRAMSRLAGSWSDVPDIELAVVGVRLLLDRVAAVGAENASASLRSILAAT